MHRKLKVLDLFCGAGGATRGLQLAGFEVHGIDINSQPRYCGEGFTQGDAVTFGTYGWYRKFDFIWASPPCQHYCAMKTMKNARKHPDLIDPIRKRLIAMRIPFVIENVFGAPLKNATMLCVSMFKLQSNGFQLRRHRYFEPHGFFLNAPRECHHAKRTLGVYGAKVRDIAQEKRHYSKPKSTRGAPIGVVLPQQWGFEAMGIDWMKIDELAESIPPAYSEWIGKQAIEVLRG